MAVCEREVIQIHKKPFPWFGGKTRIAPLVWERFGDVPNYVEPFFGGGAVLLERPHVPRTETVNDKDAYLANFWRAVKLDPDAVAHYADWPVNEIDLAARRDWIFEPDRRAAHIDRMWRDPDYFDAKLAGIWVWGVCGTIGNAWQPKSTHLGDAGRGVHRPGTHLGDAGRGVEIAEYFQQIAQRFERVRVMCGDWRRVTSNTATVHNGITGVFLDPPYESNCDVVYDEQEKGIGADVRAWAIDRGDDPKMRIALCGYEGEHNMPKTWDCVAWKARGGYGSQSNKRGCVNSSRERVWFSPNCLDGYTLC